MSNGQFYIICRQIDARNVYICICICVYERSCNQFIYSGLSKHVHFYAFLPNRNHILPYHNGETYTHILCQEIKGMFTYILISSSMSRR